MKHRRILIGDWPKCIYGASLAQTLTLTLLLTKIRRWTRLTPFKGDFRGQIALPIVTNPIVTPRRRE